MIDYIAPSVRDSLLVIDFDGGTMILLDETHVLDTVNALTEIGEPFALRAMNDVEWARYVDAMSTI